MLSQCWTRQRQLKIASSWKILSTVERNVNIRAGSRTLLIVMKRRHLRVRLLERTELPLEPPRRVTRRTPLINNRGKKMCSPVQSLEIPLREGEKIKPLTFHLLTPPSLPMSTELELRCLLIGRLQLDRMNHNIFQLNSSLLNTIRQVNHLL